MVAPRVVKHPIGDGEQVKIAAIDPDFRSRLTASVPDGIRWQVPLQPLELFAPCVK